MCSEDKVHSEKIYLWWQKYRKWTDLKLHLDSLAATRKTNPEFKWSRWNMQRTNLIFYNLKKVGKVSTYEPRLNPSIGFGKKDGRLQEQAGLNWKKGGKRRIKILCTHTQMQVKSGTANWKKDKENHRPPLNPNIIIIICLLNNIIKYSKEL